MGSIKKKWGREISYELKNYWHRNRLRTAVCKIALRGGNGPERGTILKNYICLEKKWIILMHVLSCEYVKIVICSSFTPIFCNLISLTKREQRMCWPGQYFLRKYARQGSTRWPSPTHPQIRLHGYCCFYFALNSSNFRYQFWHINQMNIKKGHPLGGGGTIQMKFSFTWHNFAKFFKVPISSFSSKRYQNFANKRNFGKKNWRNWIFLGDLTLEHKRRFAIKIRKNHVCPHKSC